LGCATLFTHSGCMAICPPSFLFSLFNLIGPSAVLITKSTIFWDIMPCGLLKTLVDFQWTSLYSIPEYSTHCNHCCENRKSYILIMFTHLPLSSNSKVRITYLTVNARARLKHTVTSTPAKHKIAAPRKRKKYEE
jgi:hypothetical protein